jgi:hypothetical protein
MAASWPSNKLAAVTIRTLLFSVNDIFIVLKAAKLSI